MLHDAGDQDVLAVAHGVHLDLRAHQVLVDEDRAVDAARQDDVHVADDLLRLKGDDHVLSAEHVAGPDQDRVTQAFRCFKGILQRIHASALRPFDAQPVHHVVEPLAVLGGIDGIGGGAQDVHAHGVKALRQLDGRLTAEGHHHAVGLLRLDHAAHVLRRQGFKVQPVGGIEVGGYGLWVIVDHDDFVALLLQSPHAVH